MATIAFDKRYRTYSVRFRFGGKYYQRSLKGMTKRQAEATRARVEETVSLIQRGRIEMPTDVDPGNFIVCDGRVTHTQNKPSLSLKQLFEVYRSAWPEGAKEESTLKLEQLHEKHLTPALQT